jgi:hypothetical protein
LARNAWPTSAEYPPSADNNKMHDYINDWYYMEPDFRGNTFQRGPVSLAQMRILLKEGKIYQKTQIRCGTDSVWSPFEDVMPLFPDTARRQQPNTAPHAFWKKLLPVVLVTVACLIAVRWGVLRETVTALPGGLSFNQEPLTRQTVIRLTNEARASNGLTDLTENDLLDAIAEERAKDMLNKQYFAHVSPSGEQVTDVAQRVGYHYKILAENIAEGLFRTNQKLVDGWMQSPGHRKNILREEVREIGTSVVKGRMHGEETWVGVQVFGLESPAVSERSCTSPSPEMANRIAAKKTELQGLADRALRLRQQIESENTSIGLERIAVGKDYKRNSDLNMRITDYNEKVNLYNQLAAELRDKETLLNSMVTEYNRMMQDYRNCQAS